MPSITISLSTCDEYLDLALDTSILTSNFDSIVDLKHHLVNNKIPWKDDIYSNVCALIQSSDYESFKEQIKLYLQLTCGVNYCMVTIMNNILNNVNNSDYDDWFILPMLKREFIDKNLIDKLFKLENIESYLVELFEKYEISLHDKLDNNYIIYYVMKYECYDMLCYMLDNEVVLFNGSDYDELFYNNKELVEVLIEYYTKTDNVFMLVMLEKYNHPKPPNKEYIQELYDSIEDKRIKDKIKSKVIINYLKENNYTTKLNLIPVQEPWDISW